MTQLISLGSSPPAARNGMVWIPGGSFTMGSEHHYAEEAPARSVEVGGFWIDPHPVTNARFRDFVTATGHLTAAERAPTAQDYPHADPALLVPASIVFTPPAHRVDLRDHLRWWSLVPGADWRHPYGPDSGIDGLDEHPVVHVAYEDAAAYAVWAGAALPTETEWEYAASSATRTEFAWGDSLTPDGAHMANVWQGEFPLVNLRADGYERTSPVGSFPANRFGLYDMIGNVWEWTTSDFGAHPPTSACCAAAGTGTDKVMKGGSFLCAPSYCQRYRPAARMRQTADTSTCHLGFRLVVRES